MHYHLIGICGTAMASLAGMLQARGHKVTGSDENVYPPMSDLLEDLGIGIMKGYKPENLDTGPDRIIIGNTIPRGNPEVESLLNRRLPYFSQAETVKREFIRGKRSLVVAGTHGKTTSASIASWVMDAGGLDPTFLVGGVVQNFGTSFRVTESDYFIIEGDEYDTAYFDKKPKFMHYLPETAIIGNIEFDHADIYRDIDHIKFEFSRLVNLVPSNGRVIVGVDSPVVCEVLDSMKGKLFTNVESFGVSAQAKWQAREIDFSGKLSRFEVLLEGAHWASFETPLIGEFNVRNCLAVIIAADAWGISKEKIREGLATFRSVKRRAEVRGTERGITVIDDFAHHPTAVFETLKALKQKYPGRRLIAVFEPRSWSSRLAVFQSRYAEAFGHADYVVIADVFDTGAARKRGELLDTWQLVEDIRKDGRPGFSLPDADGIVNHLEPELRSGDVVAVMSNGGFDSIHEKLLSVLRDQKNIAAH